MTNELKACPFCGGKDLSTGRTLSSITNRVYHFVKCNKCGACGKHVAEEIRKTYDGIYEAILTAWNNRSEG